MALTKEVKTGPIEFGKEILIKVYSKLIRKTERKNELKLLKLTQDSMN